MDGAPEWRTMIRKYMAAVLFLFFLLGSVLTGCGKSEVPSQSENDSTQSSEPAALTTDSQTENEAETDAAEEGNSFLVRFGDEGEDFVMYLYDNETAAAIARHVGTSDWRLPIYHFDDYDNWEVMQYYDIPNRYEIPSDPESVTEEKAGTVYYSDPNRIILFYQNAEVSAQYTPIGYFDYTEEFLQAVLENPVLEGWGNKIVQISKGE